MTEPHRPDAQAADAVVLSPDALGSALRDIVEFVDDTGWEQPPILFALVPTSVLAERQPELVSPDDDSELSPIAQEPLHHATTDADLERVLATTSWPDGVAGAALIQEIVIVPPGSDTEDSDTAVNRRNGRTARLAVGALRDGRTLALLHLRPEPGETVDKLELRTASDLAPELRAALRQTLAD
ncbi:PPA1309 family protein [Gordonia sp. CPCC 205515]|uniref:PPA1309 family protein n=1 Tax=Gordonia sp. CPCC 205515 TaxID=3140791 RepID=UPI003AF3EA1F